MMKGSGMFPASFCNAPYSDFTLGLFIQTGWWAKMCLKLAKSLELELNWKPKSHRGCTREDTYTCTNNDTLPIWEVGVLNPNH